MGYLALWSDYFWYKTSPGIAIVGTVCDFNGRHLDAGRLQKIFDWPVPCSIMDVLGFIGISIYRIFIYEFSVIATLIIQLFCKTKVYLDCRTTTYIGQVQTGLPAPANFNSS
jgi:hypothetical protein